MFQDWIMPEILEPYLRALHLSNTFITAPELLPNPSSGMKPHSSFLLQKAKLQNILPPRESQPTSTFFHHQIFNLLKDLDFHLCLIDDDIESRPAYEPYENSDEHHGQYFQILLKISCSFRHFKPYNTEVYNRALTLKDNLKETFVHIHPS